MSSRAAEALDDNSPRRTRDETPMCRVQVAYRVRITSAMSVRVFAVISAVRISRMASS